MNGNLCAHLPNANDVVSHRSSSFNSQYIKNIAKQLKFLFIAVPMSFSTTNNSCIV